MGIQSLGVHQATHSILLVVSQDDLVSDELPSVEMDTKEEGAEMVRKMVKMKELM